MCLDLNQGCGDNPIISPFRSLLYVSSICCGPHAQIYIKHLELGEDVASELERQCLEYVQFIKRLLGYVQFIKRL